MTQKTDTQMAKEIYLNWCSLRRSIGRKATAFTEKREKQIIELLKDFYGNNISLVVEYIKTSNDNYAKFMRGENANKRDYTGFDNIFRPTKMSDKIDKAIAWEKIKSTKETYNSDGIYFPFRIVEG